MVAGVGNRYRSDDGVGVILVEAWQGKAPASVATELWEDQDGPGVAYRLLELDRPVLIVDCAELKAAGGSWRLLSGEAILAAVPRNIVSTHGLGLAEALPLAAALGYGRPLWFLGVQPFALSLGEGLSSAMTRALPGLHTALAATVAGILSELSEG